MIAGGNKRPMKLEPDDKDLVTKIFTVNVVMFALLYAIHIYWTSRHLLVKYSNMIVHLCQMHYGYHNVSIDLLEFLRD